MKSKLKCILATIFLLAFLIFFGAAQEVEDEREFDYSKKGEKGPRKWGELKKEWAACSKGSRQSPIDLSNGRVRIISKREKRKYKASNAIVRNRGHDIQVQWFGDAGSVFMKKTHYTLNQTHWHTPSEHTVNGRRYAMEQHLVHLSKDPDAKYKVAVIGVLYKIGKPDKFLSKLTQNMTSLIDKDGDINLGLIDPNDIIGTRCKKYYRYMGSLTIPPCTEGVVWTINKKVKTVSREQLHFLREAVHDYAERNARPLQKVNSRDIFLYGPEKIN